MNTNVTKLHRLVSSAARWVGLLSITMVLWMPVGSYGGVYPIVDPPIAFSSDCPACSSNAVLQNGDVGLPSTGFEASLGSFGPYDRKALRLEYLNSASSANSLFSTDSASTTVAKECSGDQFNNPTLQGYHGYQFHVAIIELRVECNMLAGK